MSPLFPVLNEENKDLAELVLILFRQLRGRRLHMDRTEKEQWMALCDQAANEHDLVKFTELMLQITVFLEAKELQLKEKSRSISPTPTDIVHPTIQPGKR